MIGKYLPAVEHTAPELKKDRRPCISGIVCGVPMRGNHSLLKLKTRQSFRCNCPELLVPLFDHLPADYDQSSILMIETGQRSTASRAHVSISSVSDPSAILPLSRNFSIIWLKESSGFSSNSLGHVSEHVPQLVQSERSMITFTKTHTIPVTIKIPPPSVHHV